MTETEIQVQEVLSLRGLYDTAAREQEAVIREAEAEALVRWTAALTRPLVQERVAQAIRGGRRRAILVDELWLPGLALTTAERWGRLESLVERVLRPHVATLIDLAQQDMELKHEAFGSGRILLALDWRPSLWRQLDREDLLQEQPALLAAAGCLVCCATTCLVTSCLH